MAEEMKLLPCPFCGDEMASVTCGEIYHKSGDQACPIIGRDHYIPAEHVEAWNRRASPPAREEAPAEGAGLEWMLRNRVLPVLQTGEARHAVEQAIAALRNRTSEPEAGAVAASSATVRTGDEVWVRAKASDVCTSTVFVFVETIHDKPMGNYVHWRDVRLSPAPATADKLRVAVEALGKAYRAWIVEGGESVDVLERVGPVLAALNEGGKADGLL